MRSRNRKRAGRAFVNGPQLKRAPVEFVDRRPVGRGQADGLAVAGRGRIAVAR